MYRNIDSWIFKGAIKHVIDVSAFDNDDDDDDDDDDAVNALIARQRQRTASGLSRKEEAIYKMYLGELHSFL